MRLNKEMRTVKDINVKGIRVLVRTDFDFITEKSAGLNSWKISSIAPTIKYLREQGARIIIATHFGVTSGIVKPELRINTITEKISNLLNIRIKSINESIGIRVKKAVADLNPGEILILENLKFLKGETLNDKELGKELGDLCDIYVNDAFSLSHKENASITGIMNHKPGYAGLLFEKELINVNFIVRNKSDNLVIVLGGTNPEIKLNFINKFLHKTSYVLTGGLVSLAFIKAKGYSTGKCYIPDSVVKMADEVLKNAAKSECEIVLPEDTVTVNEIIKNNYTEILDYTDIPENVFPVDIGPYAIKEYFDIITDADQIIWSGTMGINEIADFAFGTKAIIQAIAKSNAHKCLLGSDTLNAFNMYNNLEIVDIISASTEPFLSCVIGKEVPGIKALSNFAEYEKTTINHY